MKRESINLYNLSLSNIYTALKARYIDLEGCKVCLAPLKNGILMHEEGCAYYSCVESLGQCSKRRD